jgi:CopG-like RHH_1 or ribbon-helix-helix domain, RHH_5
MLKTKAAPQRTHGSRRKLARPRTRRTTLTLPEDLLKKVERFAATRHQTVSSAVTYLVETALRNEPESPRNSRGILEMWRKAYLPLTEEERLLVDGIIIGESSNQTE